MKAEVKIPEGWEIVENKPVEPNDMFFSYANKSDCCWRLMHKFYYDEFNDFYRSMNNASLWPDIVIRKTVHETSHEFTDAYRNLVEAGKQYRKYLLAPLNLGDDRWCEEVQREFFAALAKAEKAEKAEK
jgi:hypothetical protein